MEASPTTPTCPWKPGELRIVPAPAWGQVRIEKLTGGSLTIIDATQADADAVGRMIVDYPRLLAERDALAAFKNYVHGRLDAAGIPTDPESSHRAEGCRIGGRLDIALNAAELAAHRAKAGAA